MNKLFIILFFVAISTLTYAQSNTFNFILTSNSLKIENKTIDVLSTFTKTDNTLIWKQAKNGFTDLSTFNINNIVGTWDEYDHLGTITYNLNMDQTNYKLIVNVQEEIINLSLVTISENGTEENIYTFQSNLISYQ